MPTIDELHREVKKKAKSDIASAEPLRLRHVILWEKIRDYADAVVKEHSKVLEV